MITTLTPFLSDFIKQVIELPTEVCTSKCPEHLKNSLNISNNIKALKQKYFKIINEFDASKPDEVSVTYWMRELPEG
jgi:hypothetical protein